MESSGHYWIPLASHLARRGVPVSVVNPLAGEVLCEESAGPDQVGPGRRPEPRRAGDARSAADPRPARRARAAPGGALRDDPRGRAGEGVPAAVPAGGARLPRAAASCSTIPPAGPPGRCSGSRPRRAPRRRRRAPRSPTPTWAPVGGVWDQARAERLQAAAADTIAVPELDAEVAFEVGLLLDQFDLLERQIQAADARVAGLLDGEHGAPAADDPGRGSRDRARCCSRRSATSAGSPTSTSCSPMPGSIPPSAARAPRAPGPRPAGTCPRPATATSGRRPTGWPWWASSHNPVIAAHYARKRAAGKSPMNALGHCMRKALSLVWGVWRNGPDFDPNWAARADAVLLRVVRGHAAGRSRGQGGAPAAERGRTTLTPASTARSPEWRRRRT